MLMWPSRVLTYKYKQRCDVKFESRSPTVYRFFVPNRYSAMSSRLARQVLSTSARVSKRRVNINGPHQGCRRNMSASSHGSGEPKLTSDRPWIVRPICPMFTLGRVLRYSHSFCRTAGCCPHRRTSCTSRKLDAGLFSY